jgi:hypothetical protein
VGRRWRHRSRRPSRGPAGEHDPGAQPRVPGDAGGESGERGHRRPARRSGDAGSDQRSVPTRDAGRGGGGTGGGAVQPGPSVLHRRPRHRTPPGGASLGAAGAELGEHDRDARGGSAQPAANIAPTLASAGTASANTLGAFAAAAPVQAQQAAGGYQQQLLDALNQRQHDVNQINAQRPSLEAGYLDTAVGQNQALAAGNREFSANRSDARYQQGYQNRTFTEGKREADRTYTAGRFDANRSYTANRADTAAARAADAAKAAEATREFNKTLGLQSGRRRRTSGSRTRPSASSRTHRRRRRSRSLASPSSDATPRRRRRSRPQRPHRRSRSTRRTSAPRRRGRLRPGRGDEDGGDEGLELVEDDRQGVRDRAGLREDEHQQHVVEHVEGRRERRRRSRRGTTSPSDDNPRAANQGKTFRDPLRGWLGSEEAQGARRDGVGRHSPRPAEGWLVASGSGSKTTTSTSGTKGSRTAASRTSSSRPASRAAR